MYKIIGSDQKEYGPVSSAQIRAWIKDGRCNRLTLLQPAGTAEWKPLGQQPEFAMDLSPVNVPPIVTPPDCVPAPGDGGINMVIPYKNVRALAAYYLAVFSLIPIAGIVLGLAALVLGILGLRFRREHPAAGGGVHAWIGVILGGLCGCGYLGLVIFAVIIAKR